MAGPSWKSDLPADLDTPEQQTLAGFAAGGNRSAGNTHLSNINIANPAAPTIDSIQQPYSAF
jgi:hypothetical protein